MDKKKICSKLVKYKDDLSDDNNAITSINYDVDNLVQCFNDIIKSDNLGGIIEKIENLKEASQYNDSNISSARSYLQYEINAVNREIEEEEAAKEAAKAIAANGGGGGTF